MKKIISLLISIVLIASCSNNLTPELPDSQQLVLFAYIVKGEKITASITKSLPALENNRNLAIVDSVIATLYENGIVVDTLERIDSVEFISHVNASENNKYKIRIKDAQNILNYLETDEITVLDSPKINNVTLDSIGMNSSRQDILRLSVSFDTISGYKYLGYVVKAIKSNGKEGHHWPTLSEYECDAEGGQMLNIGIANIECFESVQKLEFETSNLNLQDIDTIKIKICKTPDFTGDYLNISQYNKAAYDQYLAFLATDDNIASNVSGGYGAVLTISCENKILVLK